MTILVDSSVLIQAQRLAGSEATRQLGWVPLPPLNGIACPNRQTPGGFPKTSGNVHLLADSWRW